MERTKIWSVGVSTYGGKIYSRLLILCHVMARNSQLFLENVSQKLTGPMV